MKKGDIYLNTYAGENNPARIFIVVEYGIELTRAAYEINGKIKTATFKTEIIKNDKEHFKLLGNYDYQSLVAERLKAEKELAGM